MKLEELQTMLEQVISNAGNDKVWTLTPEARVITGDPECDAQLHYILVECGVEVEFGKYTGILDYRVVDEQKFIMFILRYS